MSHLLHVLLPEWPSCPVVPHRCRWSRRSRWCPSASPWFLAGDSHPDGADGREGPTSKPACPSWWGTEGSTPSLLRQSSNYAEGVYHATNTARPFEPRSTATLALRRNGARGGI